MNRKMLCRMLSALIGLMLLMQPVLAETDAESPEDLTIYSAAETAEEMQSTPIEDTVEEYGDISLDGDIDLPDAQIEEPAADADDPDVAPEAIDVEEPVDPDDPGEAADSTASAETEDNGLEIDDAPEAAVESALAAQQTAEEEAVEAVPEATAGKLAAAETDSGKRTFSSTASVSGETWSNIDLVRTDGFTGKLAKVSGALKLNNVTIGGQPARSVNLLDYFTLNPGASIVVSDDAALRINFNALSINRGSAKSLSATYNGTRVKADRVKWKTSGKKLATVSKKGRIKAKKKGTATITATYKGQKAVCYLDITGIVYPKSVSIKKKVSLGLKNTLALKAKIKPAKPDDPTLTWTSNKPNVVSVDDKGNITALASGKATIRVTTSNGKSATCKVTVKSIKLKSLSFKKLYVTLHPKETCQSVLTLKPKNASYPGVVYSSSDTSVATVDANGVITGVGCGTATITAKSTTNTKVSNTCKVCVIAQDAKQLEGLIIGINPGHQRTMIKKRYPMAPGSHSYGPGVKVGATGKSTHQTEYNVVLKVGLKLKRILEEKGAKVVITRTTNDVNLTNIDRAKMLNAAGCDVALQLHCNSCSNSSKTGSSSYYRPNGKWAEENRALAIKLSKYISKVSGFKNRGINPYTDFMSLNWTTTPSVLLEMGYLSNSSDDHKLAKDSFQEKLAQGIYQGLCAYFGR